ncbi:MAG: DUF1989 domain-containing protein [Burkholderiaceae bacterium]
MAASKAARKRYRQVVPAGRSWSGLMRSGETLRIIDLLGEQAVDFLVYSSADTTERYDAQLTLLTFGSTAVTKGTKLLSNRGRELMTIVADTLGAHDTVVGCCSAEANTVRFGEQASQLHACRDNFLMELAKHGMSKRDVVPNLNFFMPVPVEDNGAIAIIDGLKEPGHYVGLKASMDVLCVLSNCPQVNNPCNGFDPTPIEVVISAGN